MSTCRVNSRFSLFRDLMQELMRIWVKRSLCAWDPPTRSISLLIGKIFSTASSYFSFRKSSIPSNSCRPTSSLILSNSFDGFLIRNIIDRKKQTWYGWPVRCAFFAPTRPLLSLKRTEWDDSHWREGHVPRHGCSYPAFSSTDLLHRPRPSPDEEVMLYHLLYSRELCLLLYSYKFV